MIISGNENQLKKLTFQGVHVHNCISITMDIHMVNFK